jgi:hypothetical protein
MSNSKYFILFSCLIAVSIAASSCDLDACLLDEKCAAVVQSFKACSDLD